MMVIKLPNKCPNCSVHDHRDENAAKKIAKDEHLAIHLTDTYVLTDLPDTNQCLFLPEK